MEQLDTCCVCLKSKSTLIHICEADCNDMKWIQKLNSCVPEVSWSDQHVICSQCTEPLEIASTFRKLCLQSYIKHQQTRKEHVNENLEEGINGLLGMVQEIKRNVDEISIRKNETENMRIFTKHFFKIVETTGSVIERKGNASVSRYRLQNKSDMLDYIHSRSQKSNIKEGVVVDVSAIDKKNEDSCTNMIINKVGGNSELPYEVIEHHADLQMNYCKICKISFEDHLHFTKHNKNIHNLEHPWSYYQTNFSTHKAVQTYEDVHIKKNKYKCKICSIPFHSRANLVSHISYKHASLNEYHQCPHCSVKCLKRHMLKQHVLKSHTHPGGDFICFHCSEGFTFKSALLTHLASEHNFKRKKCRLCKNLFGTHDDFNVHLQKEHGINIRRRKKYKYEKCSRTNSSSEDTDKYRDGCSTHVVFKSEEKN